MKGCIYEKDLRPMKFRILISPRHDLVLREIAARLGMGVQEMRLLVIRKFDMQLLENLPARYEAGQALEGERDGVDRALGSGLFTRFVPLLDTARMNGIEEAVRQMIREGSPTDDAYKRGIELLREAVRA